MWQTKHALAVKKNWDWEPALHYKLLYNKSEK